MSQRIRILLVGPVPPPVGGMATVVQNLFGEYAKTADVRLINNAKTTEVGRPLVAGIAAQLKLIGKLIRELLTWRPDAVHIHTCSFFTFWRNSVDIAIARLLGRSVYLHIHGGRFTEFLEGLSPIRQRLARIAMRSCRKVILLGENWRESMRPWVPSDRICVVANGVPLPEDAKRALADRLSIICLANYEHLKGQEDLIRALRELNDDTVSVNFYGAETEVGEKERLTGLARKLGVDKQVNIKSPVSGDEKNRALHEATCFCLPSYAEGLPMSMLEAMASRLPVIVTDVGSIPEVITSGVNGLIYSPGDISALAGHLNTLRNEADTAKKLEEAGRQLVQQSYSLEASAAKLLQIFGRQSHS